VVQADDVVWPGVAAPAARRLLDVALESFATVGFHASTTRNIAARAGLSPAAVYTHFASKDELLQTISRIGHEAALASFEDALGAGTTPEQRIGNAVRAFTTWHAENQMLARVIQYELEALPGDGQREIRALRSVFETKLRAEIAAGVRSGDFVADDLEGVARAIFSVCVDVARWYSPRRAAVDVVANLHSDLAIRMIKAPSIP
jgi:AcrR family transcriptional regulator